MQSIYIEDLFRTCGFTAKTKLLWLKGKFGREIHRIEDLTTNEKLNVICHLNIVKKMIDEARQLDETGG